MFNFPSFFSFPSNIEIVGKQKDNDVWVFNSSVQIDHQGLLIPKSEQQYIILDDQNILDVPHLTGEYKSNQSGGSKPRNNGVGGGGEAVLFFMPCRHLFLCRFFFLF